MRRRRRPKSSTRRGWQEILTLSRKANHKIDEQADKRGWSSEGRAFNLLRQQVRNNEIIDFYSSKRFKKSDKRRQGTLDVVGIDFTVLVAGMDLQNLPNKLKNVPAQAKEIVLRMRIMYDKGRNRKLKPLSEKAGLHKLKKLSRTGVFQVKTFDITSSEGTKQKKETRNYKRGIENPQPILVLKSGETHEESLRKLREIEGILI